MNPRINLVESNHILSSVSSLIRKESEHDSEVTGNRHAAVLAWNRMQSKNLEKERIKSSELQLIKAKLAEIREVLKELNHENTEKAIR